jgi:hypothetical protein
MKTGDITNMGECHEEEELSLRFLGQCLLHQIGCIIHSYPSNISRNIAVAIFWRNVNGQKIESDSMHGSQEGRK